MVGEYQIKRHRMEGYQSDAVPVTNKGAAVFNILCKNSQSSPQLKSARPDIFKLNVDCFERIFEWLSLTELLNFRRTCKRMNQVVNYYIKLNYPKVLRLSIYNDRLLSKCCYTRLNYFDWIKHLYIATYRLTYTQIKSIRYILNQIETLKLSWSEINGDLYEALLQYCPRLKYLGIGTCTLPDAIIGTGNKWLLRQYPTLEHFELENEWIYNTEESFETEDLLIFFKNNPNIRIFSTDSGLFLKICKQMTETTINFDRLDIHMKDFSPDNFDLICELINELHKHGNYNKLHLYIKHDCHYWEHAQHLWSLCNLEKLNIHAAYLLPYGFPTTKVESLTTLSIRFGFCESNSLKLMAENFVNLTRVEIHYAELNDIIPFICHAPKLQQISIKKFFINHQSELLESKDFLALNENRMKLHRARKVTIYVDEQSFLKLKWTSKLKCSLIELKQIDSCKVDHEFYWS